MRASACAASALCHGAILATLLAWHGSPPTLAAQEIVAVTLVLETPQSDGAAPAEASGSGTAAEPPPPEPARAEAAQPSPPLSAMEPMPPPAETAMEPILPPPSAASVTQRHPAPRPAAARAEVAVASAASAVAAAADPAVAAPSSPSPSMPPVEAGATALASLAPKAAAPPDAEYLAQIVAWLERHKDYPEAARARREEGTVLVAFAIDRGGRLMSFGVRHSSGSSLLDAAAEAMIRRAEPLPAMPASYPGRELALVLPVTFALRP